jgi:membrane protein DedA with SNARE-associated domain
MGAARAGERASAGETDQAARVRHPRDDKLALTLITIPIVVTSVMATIGSALLPTLIAHSPIGLIALNGRTEYLLLVSPRVSLAPFVAVGTLRWLGSSIFFYLLGHRYGPAVVRWAETKVGGRLVHWSEGLVRKGGWLVVLVSPNAPVSVVAGAGGMAIGPYVTVAAIGTVARMVLIHALGHAFTDPIHEVTSFVIRYQWPLTALTVVLVGIAVWRHRRSGTSHFESSEEIEAEIEAEIERPGH